MYCASDSLTLISQAEMQPYDRVGSRYVTRDLHLYELPWPVDVLRDLGETAVTMRVTLSYYIEPGPGEVGWKTRYRYPYMRFALYSMVLVSPKTNFTAASTRLCEKMMMK